MFQDTPNDDNEAQWPPSPSPLHYRSAYVHDDGAEGVYDVVDDWPSDDSRRSSPNPNQPPRLPSLSNESYESEESANVQSPPVSNPDTENGTTRRQPAPPIGRHALAQRLARIARQLATTTEDEHPVDPLVLTEQVNQLEMMLLGISPPSAIQGRGQENTQPLNGTSIKAALQRAEEASGDQQGRHTDDSVAETAAHLSEDLEILHSNLRARHEEATHIQALLLSRLELAAQRILSLQRQAEEMESQLRESDDELGHLRVLLKALELQVPDHPDEDLRKCLARVRKEFWAVRKRREALRKESLDEHGDSGLKLTTTK